MTRSAAHASTACPSVASTRWSSPRSVRLRAYLAPPRATLTPRIDISLLFVAKIVAPSVPPSTCAFAIAFLAPPTPHPHPRPCATTFTCHRALSAIVSLAYISTARPVRLHTDTCVPLVAEKASLPRYLIVAPSPPSSTRDFAVAANPRIHVAVPEAAHHRTASPRARGSHVPRGRAPSAARAGRAGGRERTGVAFSRGASACTNGRGAAIARGYPAGLVDFSFGLSPPPLLLSNSTSSASPHAQTRTRCPLAYSTSLWSCSLHALLFIHCVFVSCPVAP